MKFSQLISKTMRTEPTEAETASHRLMLKAGMVYQVASGVYSYLPPGMGAHCARLRTSSGRR